VLKNALLSILALGTLTAQGRPCFLITGPIGRILINTALAESHAMMLDGLQNFGFRVQDVRFQLTNQARHDHGAGLSEMKHLSGAKVFATSPDAK
jgi:metallo-beta-lactamase class B